MRAAVLRCNRLPRFVTWEIPDVDALFADDHSLIAALRDRGVDAESVAWAADVEWDRFDVAVIRSTWDYIDDPAGFLATLARIERSSCTLCNPAPAAGWNSDKGYLLDLADWGVPVVPTLRAPSGEDGAVIEAIERAGWGQVVLKPAVGAGAAGVLRTAAAGVPDALRELSAHGGRPHYLVQPLVESVMNEGEFSFIFIDGRLSHTLRKLPAPGDFRAHGIYGGTVERIAALTDDARQALAMLDALPFDLLYARIDAVRIDGVLAVMELELIEPMLYLDLAPGADGRLADAILRLRPDR